MGEVAAKAAGAAVPVQGSVLGDAAKGIVGFLQEKERQEDRERRRALEEISVAFQAKALQQADEQIQQSWEQIEIARQAEERQAATAEYQRDNLQAQTSLIQEQVEAAQMAAETPAAKAQGLMPILRAAGVVQPNETIESIGGPEAVLARYADYADRRRLQAQIASASASARGEELQAYIMMSERAEAERDRLQRQLDAMQQAAVDQEGAVGELYRTIQSFQELGSSGNTEQAIAASQAAIEQAKALGVEFTDVSQMTPEQAFQTRQVELEQLRQRTLAEMLEANPNWQPTLDALNQARQQYQDAGAALRGMLPGLGGPHPESPGVDGQGRDSPTVPSPQGGVSPAAVDTVGAVDGDQIAIAAQQRMAGEQVNALVGLLNSGGPKNLSEVLSLSGFLPQDTIQAALDRYNQRLGEVRYASLQDVAQEVQELSQVQQQAAQEGAIAPPPDSLDMTADRLIAGRTPGDVASGIDDSLRRPEQVIRDIMSQLGNGGKYFYEVEEGVYEEGEGGREREVGTKTTRKRMPTAGVAELVLNQALVGLRNGDMTYEDVLELLEPSRSRARLWLGQLHPQWVVYDYVSQRLPRRIVRH